VYETAAVHGFEPVKHLKPQGDDGLEPEFPFTGLKQPLHVDIVFGHHYEVQGLVLQASARQELRKACPGPRDLFETAEHLDLVFVLAGGLLAFGVALLSEEVKNKISYEFYSNVVSLLRVLCVVDVTESSTLAVIF